MVKTYDAARATLRKLGELDHALSTAQGPAGALNAYESAFPGAKRLGNEIWDELEKMRWRIRRMLERAERSGGVYG